MSAGLQVEEATEEERRIGRRIAYCGERLIFRAPNCECDPTARPLLVGADLCTHRMCHHCAKLRSRKLAGRVHEMVGKLRQKGIRRYALRPCPSRLRRLMDDLEDIGSRLVDGQDDPAAQGSRVALCRALVGAFRDAGHILWIGGYIIGSDRVEGRSPFEFGSDATVGLAAVGQIAGELLSGAMALLDGENSYGACALLRQLVEVEYLAWAFAEDEEEAAEWLRSSADDRRRRWQPQHLRDRSVGRFRARDYRRHCELGGHPTPEAKLLLSGHSVRLPASWWWLELATHGVSTWEYVVAATERHAYGYAEQVRAVGEEHGLAAAAASWHALDRLAGVARWAITTLRDPSE